MVRSDAAAAADMAAQAAAFPKAYPTRRGDDNPLPEGPVDHKVTTRPLGPGWVTGALVGDPTLKFTDRGKAMVIMRVAENVRVRDAETGQWTDGATRYADITVWEAQGESCVEQLRKGDRIIAAGEWQERRWYGHDDQWHTRRVLTARDIGPSMKFTPARVLRTEMEQ